MEIKARHFSWLLFISIALAAAQPAVAQEVAVGGESYTVKKGDTLWDISATKLENPFSWCKIWKQNPGIKDPDLIYPGEKIILPPGAVLKKTEESASTVGNAAAGGPTRDSANAPFVERGKTIVKAPSSSGKIISLDNAAVKAPLATASEIMAAGFISEDLKVARKITGDSLGGRDIYATGDRLFTDVDGVSIGDLFLISSITGKVNDPASGNRLGRLIAPTGSLKIIEKVGDKMVGVVEDSFADIKPDDVLVPYEQPQLVYDPVQPNPALRGKFGYIAAVKGDKSMGAVGDIVYLDMGSDIGVKPGDTFVIRRSGEKGSAMEREGYSSPSDYQIPDNVVGEVVVISVQPKSSTAKIAVSMEAFQPGYRAVYKD